MPKVSVYIRPTTANRTPKKATKGSTGPFYLRYELNGKRVWESLTTRTFTFALADARSKESSLLLGRATPPKQSPAAPKSLEELRMAFIHDKKTTLFSIRTPIRRPSKGAPEVSCTSGYSRVRQDSCRPSVSHRKVAEVFLLRLRAPRRNQ